LFYSNKCSHSAQVLHLVRGYEPLARKTRLYDISIHSLPQSYERVVSRVPTLVTADGSIRVGNEIKAYVRSLIPTNIEYIAAGDIDAAPFGSEGIMPSSRYMLMDDMGEPLGAEMTPELEQKISQKVGDKGLAYTTKI